MRRLDPRLRSALDAVLVLAAGVVVIDHLARQVDFGKIDLLFRFGQEAVVVFFFLSGFLIHANERDRVANDLGGYAARWFLRIYPALVIAMLVSVAVLAYNGTLAERFHWQDAACTLFALQDASALKPGTICGPFLDNSPLWSLSYELLFYALYPLVLPFFLRAAGPAQHAIGLASLAFAVAYLAMPSHFLLLPAYFVIWWLGAAMAEAVDRGTARLTAIAVPLAYVLLTLGVWVAKVVASGGIGALGTYPFLMVGHFLVAAIFTLIASSPLGPLLARAARLVPAAAWAWLASFSYGIYVLHNQLLIHWEVAKSWLGFALAFALLILLAWLSDNPINQAVRKWMKR
ncbi:MAG: acyltransferase [Pseudomonadota bacterium]|nr:acyltransferase [Pseudomonadota bacterium]